MIVEWTGLSRIHGGRAATASAESTCPVNRAVNRSFALCVPYLEFLAYGEESRRIKLRFVNPLAPQDDFRSARRMRIAVAAVAAATTVTSDLNWRNYSFN